MGRGAADVTCEDAELLLATSAVGSLDIADAGGLRLHLQGCPHCRIEGGLYLHAASMIADSVEPMAPPPALRIRLMARIAAEAEPPRAAAASEPRPPWRLRLWRAIPATRALTLAGGLATVAFAALAAGSFALPHGTASVAVRVPACGAAGGPAARCALTYDPAAHRSVLTVQGLPAPAVVSGAPGRTYEVWLVSGSGARSPAALLTRRPGSTEWSAAISADLSGSMAVEATAEPPGGSLTPQGPEILRLWLPADLG
jgi:Anti-sigma-K factor rskA, C-terminal